ncbi:hypothetical protein BGZ61DRAFT_439852 [Ilyonectria robusta]|uniref:uncharacterized protein n=1 Tax=Ilyonectria robusta TaxID=1079257 RepID=UPI001E8ED498|nr:uncharacterized protein BGZ61DRAFT_439852 [Ilyonectria robusta]KAH8738267.1 hypothetical protein BGZ61DRAFT_439852 [Ilyonectria robusta]
MWMIMLANVKQMLRPASLSSLCLALPLPATPGIYLQLSLEQVPFAPARLLRLLGAIAEDLSQQRQETPRSPLAAEMRAQLVLPDLSRRQTVHLLHPQLFLRAPTLVSPRRHLVLAVVLMTMLASARRRLKPAFLSYSCHVLLQPATLIN